MTMEDFIKMLLPSVLGAVAGYGAIRSDLAALRARVEMLTELMSETRRRVDQFSDSKGH